jgi:hypothetical protein
MLQQIWGKCSARARLPSWPPRLRWPWSKQAPPTETKVYAGEFGVTQHINGKHILAGFKDLFDGKGSLHLKPGSQDVWEYKPIRLD